jgi:predicted RNA polymerase sigma factor
MTDFRSAVEEVFRRESGRIIAGLIRVSQSFDLAEEAVQDALASALVDWQRNGLPANPAAWINAVAHRKLIDYARRDQTRRSNHATSAGACRKSATFDILPSHGKGGHQAVSRHRNGKAGALSKGESDFLCVQR